MRPQFLPRLAHIFAVCTLLAALPATAGEFNASLNISGKAAPADTGLRIYPGAVVVTGKNDDSDSASVRFAFGEYGLKVVAVKLKSSDSKDRIAAFYQSDLARFGTVVDCAMASSSESSRREGKSLQINCDGDRVKRNGFLFKAGVKSNMRVVSIEPKGDETQISLVHVEIRGFD